MVEAQGVVAVKEAIVAGLTALGLLPMVTLVEDEEDGRAEARQVRAGQVTGWCQGETEQSKASMVAPVVAPVVVPTRRAQL